jgi:hypothetical protein
MLNNIEKGYFYENNEDVKVLMDFIRKPLESTTEIFDIFRNLPNAVYRESGVNDQEKFCYIEGTRPDKVLLVAHADTVWHERVSKFPNSISSKRNNIHNPQIIDGVIESTSDVGIGADDRSGIAILWLLKDMGHSILIVDGEERGMIGSSWLISHNKDIAEKINNDHSFVIQFDRRGASDFKCYSVGSNEFREYLKKETLYSEPERFSFTDICTLCYKVVGVNLSVGYYNEHTAREILVIREWIHTLNMVRYWLSKSNLPRFEINDIESNWDRYDDLEFSYKNSTTSKKSKSHLGGDLDDFDYLDYDFEEPIYSNRKKSKNNNLFYNYNKSKRKSKKLNYDIYNDFEEDSLYNFKDYQYLDEEEIEELQDVLLMFDDVSLDDIDNYKEYLSEDVFNFVKNNLRNREGIS